MTEIDDVGAHTKNLTQMQVACHAAGLACRAHMTVNQLEVFSVKDLYSFVSQPWPEPPWPQSLALAQALAQSPSLGLSPKPKPLAPALALAQAQSPSLGLTPKPKPLAPALALAQAFALGPCPKNGGPSGNWVHVARKMWWTWSIVWQEMSSQLGGVSAGLSFNLVTFQPGAISVGPPFSRATFQRAYVPIGALA